MAHFAKFRITARHAASAVAVAASLYFSFAQLEDNKRRNQRDLELSSALLADGLREAVEPLMGRGSSDRLTLLAERFGRRGRLAGFAVFSTEGRVIVVTRSLKARLKSPPQAVLDCLKRGTEAAGYESVDGTRMQVDALPLHKAHGASGALAVFQDTSFIETRMVYSRLTNARRMAIQCGLFLAAVWAFGLLFK